MGEGFFLGFEKQAAPKWIKMLRAGKLDPKKIPQASVGQIRQLDKKPIGQGLEGVVHKVTHPKGKGGIAVQKSLDPRSPILTRDVRKQKIKIMKESKNPLLPDFYGTGKGERVTYQEYIKPAKHPTPDTPKAKKQLRELIEENKKKNVLVGDAHEGNVITTDKGDTKLVDFVALSDSKKQKRILNNRYRRSSTGYRKQDQIPHPNTVMNRAHNRKG